VDESAKPAAFAPTAEPTLCSQKRPPVRWSRRPPRHRALDDQIRSVRDDVFVSSTTSPSTEPVGQREPEANVAPRELSRRVVALKVRALPAGTSSNVASVRVGDRRTPSG
jgi:hypothetical protein